MKKTLLILLLICGFYPAVVMSQGSWSVVSTGTTQNLWGIHFPSSNLGYAVGDGPTILKTNNGGNSWTSQTPATPNLLGIFFTSVTTGYAVGQTGTILKTTDGSNWSSLTSGTTSNLYKVYFTDPSTGYVIGSNGTIRKTINGGTNWTAQTSGTTLPLRDIFFLDSNTGFIAGGAGLILKTTDAGASWVSQTTGTPNDLYSVSFPDGSNGFLAGQLGVIRKSINGGVAWTDQTSNTSNTLFGMHFINSDAGYAVGSGGTIRKTVNGGTAWTTETSNTSADLQDVVFIDGNTGFAIGTGGTIIKYTVPSEKWSTKASMTTGRWGSGAGNINGTAYVAGGYASGTHLSNHEAYTISTNSWTSKTAHGVQTNPAYGVINNILYTAGGSNTSVEISDLWSYNPTNDTWTAKTSLPAVRQSACGASVGGLLYVVGGRVGSTSLSSMVAYDPIANTWSTKTAMPTARTAASAGVINGLIYVAGGITAENLTALSTLEVYDPSSNTWVSKAAMPAPRYAASCEVLNGILYVIGGLNSAGTVVATVEAYDPVANTWSTKTSLSFARAYSAAVANNGLIYVIGGHNSANAPVVQVEEYSPTNVPTIGSFTPASGLVGTSVTITGTNFSSTATSNVVYFGATKVTPSSASNDQLTVAVPAGATFGPITVMVNNLTAFSAKPFLPVFSGSGTMVQSSFDSKVDMNTGTGPWNSELSDLNADGKPDLVIVAQTASQVSVHQNQFSGTIGPTTFSSNTNFSINTNPVDLKVADLDGDGKPDVITAHNIASNNVNVLRNTTSGSTITFAPKVELTAGVGAAGVAIADFDYDGKPDIAIANTQDGTITVFRNTGTPGSISFSQSFNGTTGGAPIGIAAGDLDGDGNADLAVAGNTNNSVSVLRNTTIAGGSISFSTKVDLTGNNGVYKVVMGDFDSDGRLDLAAANYGASQNVSVFKNNSSPGGILTFATKVDYLAPNSTFGIALADVDGNSRLDLIATTPASNGLTVFSNTTSPGIINSNSFDVRFAYITGTQPFSITIGDIDSDGKPEMLTSNFGSNNVSIFRNNMTTSSSVPTISTFVPSSGPVGTSVTITGTNFSTTPANNTVRFNGTTATITGTPSTTSIVTSVPAGATTGTVSVTVGGVTATSTSSFTVLATQPTAQPTNLTFSNLTTTSVTGNFQAATGNPDGYLILFSANVSPDITPVDGVPYAYNELMGNVSGNNVYNVGQGNVTSFNLVSLTPGETLYFKAFAYNGSGATTNYLTTTPLLGNVTIPLSTSGNALNFDGTNDIVTIPSQSFLNATTELTLEAWVNLANSTTDQKIFAKSTGSTGYALGVVSGKLFPEIWNGVDNFFQAGTVPSNQWTHLAVTFKTNGSMIGYVNGVQVQSIVTGANSILSNTTALTIGGASFGTVYYVNGSVDEVAIWNVARTAAQIQADMAGNITPTSSLVAYYDFNQGVAAGNNPSVTSLTDKSTNANNGALSNFALTGATSNWVAGASTTPDTTPPTVSAYSPTDNATNVAATSNLVITFNESVQKGTGNIIIREGSSITQTIAVTNSAVTISGSTLTIDPGNFGLGVANVNVQLAAGVIEDLAGNDFSGILDATTWNFSVAGAVPGITDNTLSTVEGGADLTISANIFITGATITNASVEWRSISKGGSSTTTTTNLPSSGPAYSTTIIASSIGNLGIEYRITATSSLGTSATTGPAFKTVRISIPPGSGLTIPYYEFGAQVENYRIIAIPLQLTNPSANSVFDELGTYDNTKWRMFRYTGTTTELSGSASLQPGLGYWFIARRDPNTDIKTGPGTTVDVSTASPFKVSLNVGWNQIGNPYYFKLNWQDILDANPTLPSTTPFHTYENGFSADTELDEMQGAFVNVSAAMDLVFPVRNPDGGRKAGGNPSEHNSLVDKDWKVRLHIKHGNLVNGISGFGMNPKASIDVDEYDDINMPRFFDEFIELNHPNKVRDEYNSFEMVPTSNEFVWEFSVEATGPEPLVSFSWDNSYFGENDNELYLWDVALQRSINMREVNSYTFDKNKSKSFRAIFGSKDYVKEKIAVGELVLHTPWPNPSAGDVTFSFSLPESENTQAVDFVISDVMGRTFMSASDNFVSGYHEITWKRTREEPPGIYFVRLQSGSTSRLARFVLKAD